MFYMTDKLRLTTPAFFLFMLLPMLGLGDQVIEYEYDAQGRLIIVKDSQNGDRNYFHDLGGNRTDVVIGLQSDPIAPTGLSCSQIGRGAYQARWTAVDGASYYRVRSTATSNPETTTTSTSIVFNGASCKWVQACNANACGEKSNF